jgi:hypothetical protein
MIVQKLYDIRPELPARDNSSAWTGIVDGTTVLEWNLTPELGTVNHQGIIDFDHRPNISKSELPRSKLRGIKFPKKLSSPLMGED